MKRSITFTTIAIVFMNSCGSPRPSNYYEYGNFWSGTTKTKKVLKKKDKVKKLTVWNYTSTIFPSKIIKDLPLLQELHISSDSSDLESNLDDYLKIKTEELSKLRNLKDLDIGTFSMDSFPTQLSHEELENLEISIDGVTTLNTDFSKLKKLKKLSIWMSDLEMIAKGTRFPASLTHLTLHSKKLKAISFSKNENTKIERINLYAKDLSNKHVVEIIKTFMEIESLKKMTIYIQSCRRKKYLSSIIGKESKIKFRTEESCSKLLK